MKKCVLSALLLIITVAFSLAQVPQAFKYQAVARDNSGNVLSSHSIAVRISILPDNADGTPVYSETHNVTTNSFGLINLDIGLGKNTSGQISDISWSSGSYFLKIEMDETGGSNFKPMGTSQLLSVPFALYSGSASGLVPPDGDSGGPGVPANVWSLFGNSNSNPPTDHLGTTDEKDLVMITNNIERLRIWSYGNVDIAKSLKVGENLTVEKNVFLNTVSGATINNGPFTVANLSPTLLSGSLTVDLATDLNSSLNVDGVTDLNSAFHVNNASPSLMTGTLLLNGDGTFNQHLLLDNASLNSFLPTNGALVVKGGTGIGKNLNVGGDAIFDGHVTIKGPLALTDTTPSTSPTTGALTVAGGVGIGRQLNVGGMSQFFKPVLALDQVTIIANPGLGREQYYSDYPMRIEGSDQGLAIKVNGSRDAQNNYISFWDKTGTTGETMWGRIEGQTIGELISDPEYIYDNIIFGSELLLQAANLIMAGIDIGSAASSSTGCVGLGACVTAPIPSLNVGAIAKFIVEIANTAIKVTEPIAYTAFKTANIGVTFSSGSGDYAEWLPKANPSENYLPGEIVGIRNGRISRNTVGADKVFVVSFKPIVLGNMPEAGRESEYEKVAFMGQVPVRVLGKVKSGDCIIPSGSNNGLGIAVSPDKMRPADYSNIVGIAWSDSKEELLNVVNVAVGLNNNDAAKLLASQEEKIASLEKEVQGFRSEMSRTNQLLAKLVPGFAEEAGIAATTEPAPAPVSEPYTGKVSVQPVDAVTIVYFKASKDDVMKGYQVAEEAVKAKGVNLDEHPFFSKVRSNPAEMQKMVDEVLTAFNKAVEMRAEMDRDSGSNVEVR